ncbi:sensor histidine kinase [Streptomyces coelicoflavus]|uniref:histidine kinase n=1 Tax=Streptomyces coelicoflavus TaxID=285562 RepID=A0A6N9UPG8_9ACTN|nr:MULTISPECIES: sensor histidine kinase [Streptomyces]KPC77455.1 histidine kinase [Streptomyces sp. NRRL WC-3753]NEB16982.1 sensor histidine kinase [Streptomyces coelicoflavus]
MQPTTAWQAMAQRPLSFLTSSWPWRSLAYLSGGVLVGAAAVLFFALGLAAGLVLLVVLIGVAPLVGLVFTSTVVATVERRRLRLVDLDRVSDPHRAPEAPGLRGWVATRLKEQATWRELMFTLLSAVALWWLDLMVLGFSFGLPATTIASTDGETWPWTVFGVLVLLSTPYTVTSWAGARAAMARSFLAPRDRELGEELREVRASQSRLLDSFDAERIRIERDLHDGAQQHLVSLGMTLGLMRLDVEPGSPQDELLTRAERQLSTAHQELRALIRGLNPPVLADHGLVAAIEDYAGRFPIPVTVDLNLPERLPRKLETTMYYLINEAMTNIAKHSGARTAAVRGRYHSDLLVLDIKDDGRGGLDPAGSGVTGLADRVTALDGRMRVSSPSGGPTLLHVEVPCRFA